MWNRGQGTGRVEAPLGLQTQTRSMGASLLLLLPSRVSINMNISNIISLQSLICHSPLSLIPASSPVGGSLGWRRVSGNTMRLCMAPFSLYPCFCHGEAPWPLLVLPTPSLLFLIKAPWGTRTALSGGESAGTLRWGSKQVCPSPSTAPTPISHLPFPQSHGQGHQCCMPLDAFV